MVTAQNRPAQAPAMEQAIPPMAYEALKSLREKTLLRRLDGLDSNLDKKLIRKLTDDSRRELRRRVFHWKQNRVHGRRVTDAAGALVHDRRWRQPLSQSEEEIVRSRIPLTSQRFVSSNSESSLSEMRQRWSFYLSVSS